MLIDCLIFTATEWKPDRSKTTHVWAHHSASARAWYFPHPLTNEREDDIVNLPRNVMLDFEPLPPASFRGTDVFAYRLGTAHLEDTQLDRDWVAADPPAIVFSEPKDECGWDGISEQELG